MIALQLAVFQIADLDGTIPAARHNYIPAIHPLLQRKVYKNTSFVSSPTKKPNIEDEHEEFAAGYDDDTESASFLDDDIHKGDNLYKDVMTGKKISL